MTFKRKNEYKQNQYRTVQKCDKCGGLPKLRDFETNDGLLSEWRGEYLCWDCFKEEAYHGEYDSQEDNLSDAFIAVFANMMSQAGTIEEEL